MITNIARFISIVAHPALIMPLAAAIAANSNGDHQVEVVSVFIAIFFAVFVFIYSLVKAKIGQWKHVDASMKHERKELNLVASVTLVCGGSMLFLLKSHPSIVFAVVLSGVVFLLCHLLSRVSKPSLHFGFAIFATCILFPNKTTIAAFLVLTAFIGWSRIYLERHTWLDLAAGAGIGLFAGLCFQFIVHEV